MTAAVGEMAPDFTAPTDGGGTLTMSSLRGKTVVLFFYPKDDTSGCTKEACSFRDALPRFDKLDAVVLGVSRDSAASHRKFKEKFELPYTLLVDKDREIATAYGIMGEKSMYGKKYITALRTTFVIDPDGRIAKVFENVVPENHAAEVAEAVAAVRARH
jgi:peroxiredoxin Q/BCP